jgi:fumarylpyruvate hydrolase
MSFAAARSVRKDPAMNDDSRYVIQPPAQPSLAVVGSDKRFAVGRIYCVGRNYAEHAREMGHDPNREPPFFFMKTPSSLVESGSTLPFPVGTKDLHHEIELVVALGKGGRDVPVEKAMDLVWGYAVGLDMTRRDLQNEAKKAGRPWEMGKSFDQSAPCTALKPASAIGHPKKGAIWVKVNGTTKQTGDIDQMIWSTAEQIAYLSNLVTLQSGDLIFTGTPAGVSAVQPGDRLEGHVDGVGDLAITYQQR